jgi:hypothetical protein
VKLVSGEMRRNAFMAISPAFKEFFDNVVETMCISRDAVGHCEKWVIVGEGVDSIRVVWKRKADS